MKSEEQIEYEKRVKNRVMILRKLIEEGRFKIAYDSQFEESLNACRFDSNGEPDIDTIDGAVRSMALLAEQFNYRDETKNAISLKEIQQRYFDYIEGNFGFFFKKMTELNLTPHEAARRISYGENNIDYLNDNIELLLNDIIKFWEIYSEPAYIHLEDDYRSIKAVFGGDLFPANDDNIASKCGIYADTIVLPCPFIRSKNIFSKWDKKQRVYYLLKHALNLLQYKLLAIADIDKPIVVILPDKEMLTEYDLERVRELGDVDGLYHANKIFNRKFTNSEELFEFANKLDTVDKVMREIKDEKKVLFDLDYQESLEKQIQSQANGQSSQMLGSNNPGIIIAALGFGRMGVCNELLLKSAKLRGVPLIDAPTSWQYFKWKLEYDTERTHHDDDFSKLHIVKGLDGLTNTPIQWIGKIPVEGLIELRKSGAINEVRLIISEGIKDLELSNKFDFNTTSERVFANLNKAFKQHEENIKVLQNKKWKFAGKDIGSWLVIGTIEVAAACTGKPLFGLSSIMLNQILDAPKIREIPQKITDLKNENDQIKKSPIGIMFKYKN